VGGEILTKPEGLNSDFETVTSNLLFFSRVCLVECSQTPSCTGGNEFMEFFEEQDAVLVVK
jgi:hypothetical protein